MTKNVAIKSEEALIKAERLDDPNNMDIDHDSLIDGNLSKHQADLYFAKLASQKTNGGHEVEHHDEYDMEPGSEHDSEHGSKNDSEDDSEDDRTHDSDSLSSGSVNDVDEGTNNEMTDDDMESEVGDFSHANAGHNPDGYSDRRVLGSHQTKKGSCGFESNDDDDAESEVESESPDETVLSKDNQRHKKLTDRTKEQDIDSKDDDNDEPHKALWSKDKQSANSVSDYSDDGTYQELHSETKKRKRSTVSKKHKSSKAKKQKQGKQKQKQEQQQKQKLYEVQKGKMMLKSIMPAGAIFNTHHRQNQQGEVIPEMREDITRRDQVAKDLLKKGLQNLTSEEEKLKAQDECKCFIEAMRAFKGSKPVDYWKNQGRWSLTGLKTSLYTHQVFGIALCRLLETKSKDLKGGILADDPGLGKTLQIIGLIIHGGLRSQRCTLIIVPKSVISQWYLEIEKHCESQHLEPKKPRRGNNTGQASNQRYSNISRRSNRSRHFENMDPDDLGQTITWQDVENYELRPKAIEKKLVLLATYSQVLRNEERFQKMNFHRLVLDEGHFAKNHISKTCKSIAKITAKFRWIVTGTPLVNGLGDMYGYMEVLQYKKCTSKRQFSKDFDLSTEDGEQNTTNFLREHMIRRTTGETLLGFPVLVLPPVYETRWLIKLDKPMALMYELLKARLGQKITRYLVADRIDEIADLAKDESKNEANENNEVDHKAESAPNGAAGKSEETVDIFRARLRLRQLCNHFILIEATLRQHLTEDDIQQIRAVCARYQGNLKLVTSNFLRMRQSLKGGQNYHYADSQDESKSPEYVEIQPQLLDWENENIVVEPSGKGKSHGTTTKSYNYDSLWHDSRAPPKQVNCAFCRNPPVDEHILNCPGNHLTCYKCYQEEDEKVAEGENVSEDVKCPICGGSVTEDPVPSWSVTAKGENQKPHLEGSKGWLGSYRADWKKFKPHVIPSAKTLAFKAQIMNWIDEDPDCKIVVFSHFLDMLDIYAAVCSIERWVFAKYTGALSQKEQQILIETFTTSTKARVLLCSAQAAGVGLNLTMASRVMIMDPWWNEAGDYQRFRRTHRIGQGKPCHLVRFFTETPCSVETYMHHVQTRKETDIVSTMSSGSARDYNSITETLQNVFGIDCADLDLKDKPKKRVKKVTTSNRKE